MKKILVLLFIGVLASCGEAPKEEKTEIITQDTVFAAESSSPDAVVDTSVVDSNSYKLNTLLVNTENAYTKVNEIKAIKEENKALKKELKKTKSELYEMKVVLADTIEGAD